MARATNTSTESTKGTRPRKTPAERAQLDYDKALKSYESAQTKLDKIKSGIDEAQAEVTRSKRYLDFARMNPDLPPQAEAEPETAASEDEATPMTAVEERELQPA